MIGIEGLVRLGRGRQYVSGAGDTGTGYDDVCVNENLNNGTYQVLLELLLVYICNFLLLYLLPFYLLNLRNFKIDLRVERGKKKLSTLGYLVGTRGYRV